MVTRYTFNKTTWIDMLAPTADELRPVLEECAIPHEFANDLTGMTPHTETRLAKDALKITLDFPTVKRTDLTHPHEIKFIVTKTHLLTIRFEDIEAVHQFAGEFEMLGSLKRAGKRATGGHAFLALLSYLYEDLNTKLDYLESRMHEIEGDMFNDNEKEILIDISQAGRRLISFQQTVSAHRTALSDLIRGMETTFGRSYVVSVEHIILRYEHLLRRVAALTHTLELLRDTDNALLSAKQNEIMKTLTIMAFITFPLTLFSSLFGMNTLSTPIAGSEHDFWIIVGIMALVSVGFFGYFKYRKWM